MIVLDHGTKVIPGVNKIPLIGSIPGLSRWACAPDGFNLEEAGQNLYQSST
jgi:hypothetical protein